MYVVCRRVLHDAASLQSFCPLARRCLSSTAISSAASLTLRPYQTECIDSCVKAVEEGQRRVAVSLATGGGKTVIFSHLIAQIKSRDMRSQTLILVHRRELVEQAANHCRRTCVGSTVELEMGIHKASGNADVTVCSIQSLLKRLDNYDPSRVKLIIIDEAHHAAAKTYLQALEYFGADSAESEIVLVGFSATLFRRDGLQLSSVFDSIVFNKDYLSMMRDKYLCPVKITCVKLENVSLRDIKLSGPDGDFALGQLASTINTEQINNAAVRAWLDRAKGRKSTIAFAVNIQHVIDLAECFRCHGIDARAVTSRNDKKERGDLVAAFRNGEYPVLINCGIFTEGFDSPNIDCVLLTRPTKSVGLLVQMIGRGMRLSPDKQDCHIIDMTSCLDVGVASLPTLFGLNPNDLTDEELSIEQLAERAERAAELAEAKAEAAAKDATVTQAEDAPPTTVTYMDYDDMEELMSDIESRGRQHISRMSQLSWVQVDESKYILALGSKGFIRLAQSDPMPDDPTKVTWTGTFTRKLPREADARLSRPQVLFDKVDSLDRAVAGCDTAALNRLPRQFLLRNAPWRSQEASDQQKEWMRKLGSRLASEGGRITRAQATDFITRCIHGGKAAVDKANRQRKAAHDADRRRYKQVMAQEAKLAKAAEKAERRDKIVYNEASVGPLS